MLTKTETLQVNLSRFSNKVEFVRFQILAALHILKMGPEG